MRTETGSEGRDKQRIFETLLSSPGMGDKCKMVLSPSRQTILFLCRMMEQGLAPQEGKAGDEMLALLPAGSEQEVKDMMEEMLQRSGLVDFYARLKLL